MITLFYFNLSVLQVGSTSFSRSYSVFTIRFVLSYFSNLTVSYHDIVSMIGFCIFLIIFNQIWSGIMLALSLVNDSMSVPQSREEEDLEDLYTDDFFWLHERGVDYLFLFVFIHLFRKMYLLVWGFEQLEAWKQGAFLFLILQFVVFTGIVLSCSHLSDVTLAIASNAMQTFFLFKGKAYWWLFTDKAINTDTLIRLAYLHYVSAFVLAFMSSVHGVDMHYDWKNDCTVDGLPQELFWWDEALASELSRFIDLIALAVLICWFLYTEPEALSYEIFMWGDIGMSTDVRYLGVAPHWYFRPYMAWLVVCPFHNFGIFGLVLFFCIFYYLPDIQGDKPIEVYVLVNTINKTFNWGYDWSAYSESKPKELDSEYVWYVFRKPNRRSAQASVSYQFAYFFFLMAILYTSTFLPYGRFYNQLGGNNGFLFSYLYIFSFLATPGLHSYLISDYERQYEFYRLMKI